MRTRHVVRPRLESMEDRLALSALGTPIPTAEVHVNRHALVEAHRSHEAAVHAARHAAAASHPHAAKPKTTSSSSSTGSFASSFSQFFKSAFGGL